MISQQEYMDLIEITKASFQEMQQQIDKEFAQIRQELGDFRREVNQRFDYHEKWLSRIDSNMVQKNSFNTLIKILEQKEVITKYESAHILHPNTI